MQDSEFCVGWCLSGWASSNLRELCHSLFSCGRRRTLRSSVHGDLVVPFAWIATIHSRFFSVVGPTTLEWASLISKTPPKLYLLSVSPTVENCFFLLACVVRASE